MHRHENMEQSDESQREEGKGEGGKRLTKDLICILEAQCMDLCTSGVPWAWSVGIGLKLAI